MIAPTLHTERLTLRAHNPSDFSDWLAFCTSDAAHQIGGPMTEKRAWTFFAEAIAQWSLFGVGAWAVDTKDGQFIGQISLSERPGYPETELGWILFPNFQGKGYAVEAAMAARTHTYQHLARRTLVSYISPGNVSSVALATRLGASHDADAPLPDWSPCDVYRHPAPEMPQ